MDLEIRGWLPQQRPRLVPVTCGRLEGTPQRYPSPTPTPTRHCDAIQHRPLSPWPLGGRFGRLSRPEIEGHQAKWRCLNPGQVDVALP